MINTADLKWYNYIEYAKQGLHLKAIYMSLKYVKLWSAHEIAANLLFDSWLRETIAIPINARKEPKKSNKDKVSGKKKKAKKTENSTWEEIIALVLDGPISVIPE